MRLLSEAGVGGSSVLRMRVDVLLQLLACLIEGGLQAGGQLLSQVLSDDRVDVGLKPLWEAVLHGLEALVGLGSHVVGSPHISKGLLSVLTQTAQLIPQTGDLGGLHGCGCCQLRDGPVEAIDTAVGL